MRLFRIPSFATSAMLLAAAAFLPFTGAAQDMDTVEGVYRQQYEQYTAQENMLQQQMEGLAALKAQVDSLISQVAGSSTENYAQEAAKYRQLQLLLPSAIQYSADLGERDRQLAEVRRRKADLRATILGRQSALPIWWVQ